MFTTCDATLHAFAHGTSVSSEQTCGRHTRTDGPTGPRLRGEKEERGDKQRETLADVITRGHSSSVRLHGDDESAGSVPESAFVFFLLLHRRSPEKQFAQLKIASRRLGSYWSEMTGMSEPPASQPGSHSATLTCKDATLFFFLLFFLCAFRLHNAKKKSFTLLRRRAKKEKKKKVVLSERRETFA